MARLLVFATLLEANESLKRLDAKQISDNRYSFSDGEIVISGIGLHAAQSAVSDRFQEVWNLGIAGALVEDLSIGEVTSIGKVIKYVPPADLDSFSLEFMHKHLPPFQLEGEYTLASSDFPIHSKKHRPKDCQLVDMEGYAIAYACNALNIRCKIWKVVSDFASLGGPEMIRKNFELCAQIIANKVEDESSCHS